MSNDQVAEYRKKMKLMSKDASDQNDKMIELWERHIKGPHILDWSTVPINVKREYSKNVREVRRGDIHWDHLVDRSNEKPGFVFLFDPVHPDNVIILDPNQWTASVILENKLISDYDGKFHKGEIDDGALVIGNTNTNNRLENMIPEVVAKPNKNLTLTTDVIEAPSKTNDRATQ